MAKRTRPSLLLPAVTAFMAIAVAILAQKINALNADTRSQASFTKRYTCNQICQQDSDCQSGYCYEPPPPPCPAGKVCAVVMPQKVCRYRDNPTNAACASCTPNLSVSISPQDRCTTNTFKQALIVCQNDKRTTIYQTSCATRDQFKTLADKYCQTMTSCKK